MGIRRHCFSYSGIIFLLLVVIQDAQCFQAEFGGTCNATEPCRPDLDCVSERCQCRFPDHQNYMREIEECVSLVEGPCQDGDVEYSCVENAECVEVNTFFECACKTGFAKNIRRCYATFGEPCKVNGDCYNPSSSNSSKIICMDGQCGCPSLQIYDESSEKCHGLVGSKCGSNLNPPCINGAACEKYDSTNGICRCAENYVTTPDRNCIAQ